MTFLTVMNSGCIEARIYARECARIVLPVKMSKELKEEIRQRGMTEAEKKFHKAVIGNNANLEKECG